MKEQSTDTMAEICRALIAAAATATLATLDRRSQGPSASLIALATLRDNTPVFLISALAEHTKNLKADARASLLLDGTGDYDDPLTGPRLTLIGTARPIVAAMVATAPDTQDEARARYLHRHADAVVYVDFADFEFYQFNIERAHFVGGFGKISAIAPEDLKLA